MKWRREVCEGAARGKTPRPVLVTFFGLWARGDLCLQGRALEAAERLQEPRLVLDYAQVSLDLALLLLEQGRTSEAATLAHQMKWIFSSQGIEREALAALKVFCEAAWREVATVDLARRVIRFLHQSQHDPGLKFEEAERP